MESVPGRTLARVVISLTFSRKRGAWQTSFKEGRFSFLELLTHTFSVPFIADLPNRLSSDSGSYFRLRDTERVALTSSGSSCVKSVRSAARPAAWRYP